jgi:hypothetical protein
MLVCFKFIDQLHSALRFSTQAITVSHKHACHSSILMLNLFTPLNIYILLVKQNSKTDRNKKPFIVFFVIKCSVVPI